MTDVLAVAEHRRGELRDVSFELVTAGRELADARDGTFHLAVLGGDEAFPGTLNRKGVDVVHAVEAGPEFNHDTYLEATASLYETTGADALLIGNTVNGLDYAPAVATDLDVPLVTDVIDIDPGPGVEVGDGDGNEREGGLAVTREAYAGKVETTLDVTAGGFVLTLRPTEWPRTEADGDAEVRRTEVDVDEAAVRSTVNGFQEVAGGDVDITEAEVLVSVGRGIDAEENIPIVQELADALDATLSSSRPIVDNGWLPKNRQVGQSGKVVTPDVYIAIGISGAVQHVAGMKGSDTIVAINTDPSAPIMDIADYAIVDDLFDVVPELVEEFGGAAP